MTCGILHHSKLGRKTRPCWSLWLARLPSQTRKLCLAPKLCRTGSVRKSTAPFLLRHAPFGAGVSQASADMPIRAKTAGPRPRLLLKLARADKLRRRRRGDEPVAAWPGTIAIRPHLHAHPDAR